MVKIYIESSKLLGEKSDLDIFIEDVYQKITFYNHQFPYCEITAEFELVKPPNLPNVFEQNFRIKSIGLEHYINIYFEIKHHISNTTKFSTVSKFENFQRDTLFLLEIGKLYSEKINLIFGIDNIAQRATHTKKIYIGDIQLLLSKKELEFIKECNKQIKIIDQKTYSVIKDNEKTTIITEDVSFNTTDIFPRYYESLKYL